MKPHLFFYFCFRPKNMNVTEHKYTHTGLRVQGGVLQFVVHSCTSGNLCTYSQSVCMSLWIFMNHKILPSFITFNHRESSYQKKINFMPLTCAGMARSIFHVHTYICMYVPVCITLGTNIERSNHRQSTTSSRSWSQIRRHNDKSGSFSHISNKFRSK